MSNELIRIIEYLSVYNVTVYVIDYVVKHDYTALDNIRYLILDITRLMSTITRSYHISASLCTQLDLSAHNEPNRILFGNRATDEGSCLIRETRDPLTPYTNVFLLIGTVTENTTGSTLMEMLDSISIIPSGPSILEMMCCVTKVRTVAIKYHLVLSESVL
ncbi:uncharacterized protein SETTUDRAFT_33464 [Exserohilum turcica Et28A]|uniref:Uncharacterized protein n=1 Tax=Exserohilum turcicum (strain 28A) TaxID=671987 RepID=R0K4A3_EXST2|nr:uncharacterized protein SETTUDRAFT_33464 [Exserohilum turcica Et28A]EOA83142.1 hypothetical protein SETTUDRAFT_33464 [Exserohilum turcica Et28A]